MKELERETLADFYFEEVSVNFLLFLYDFYDMIYNFKQSRLACDAIVQSKLS